MEDVYKVILIGIIVVVAFGAFISLLVRSVHEGEKVECNNWERQSEVYMNWFAAGWQTDQCKNYGIDLPGLQVKK